MKTNQTTKNTESNHILSTTIEAERAQKSDDNRVICLIDQYDLGSKFRVAWLDTVNREPCESIESLLEWLGPIVKGIINKPTIVKCAGADLLIWKEDEEFFAWPIHAECRNFQTESPHELGD